MLVLTHWAKRCFAVRKRRHQAAVACREHCAAYRAPRRTHVRQAVSTRKALARGERHRQPMAVDQMRMAWALRTEPSYRRRPATPRFLSTCAFALTLSWVMCLRAVAMRCHARKARHVAACQLCPKPRHSLRSLDSLMDVKLIQHASAFSSRHDLTNAANRCFLMVMW